MSWGAGPWGVYPWGHDSDTLDAVSTVSGEFEEDYGASSSAQSGGNFDFDAAFLMDGGSTTGGLALLDFGGLMVGGSTTGGEFTAETLAALTAYACYILNRDTGRTYQYDNYGFYGFGKFGGKLIGAKGSKIYDLESTAADDDGTDISCYFEVSTDFGLPNHAALRTLLADDHQVKITLTDKDGNQRSFNTVPNEFRSIPHGAISGAWTIKVENINGQQITFRRLAGEVAVERKKNQ